jgi:hypothetical protein
MSAFRDESLASVPETLRAASPCFCLAHEMAHLIQRKENDVGLHVRVDGLPLLRHIERDLREVLKDQEHIATMLSIVTVEIDASNLLNEIDADLRALESVSIFITQKFSVPLSEAVRCVLLALEAQCFMYAAKFSCGLLKRYGGILDKHGELVKKDWINSIQVSVRARCALRRAGIILARWSEPNEALTAEKISRYVPIVDSMVSETETVRAEVSADFHKHFYQLAREVSAVGTDQNRNDFDAFVERVNRTDELKLDLFYLLVSMGFPGGTDVVRYLGWLFTTQTTVSG